MILLIVAVLGTQLLLARHDLLQGVADLRAASASIHSFSDLRNTQRRHALQQRLRNARREFAGARSNLRWVSPIITNLGWVPGIGSQLAAASPAADAGYYTAASAQHLIAGTSALWPAVEDRRSRTPLLQRVAPALATGRLDFVTARDDAGLAAAATNDLPVSSSYGTMDRATARLRHDLPSLQAASTWLAVAPAVLGMASPSYYLLAWQNPAEIRATGGFIGSADFITANKGAVASHFTGGALPHEVTSVRPPLPESAFTYEYYWLFRDSNWSPDFPTSARVERWFFGEGTGQWADGVIDVTDTIAPEILRATGPVYLPEYHRWANAGNAAFLAQQYVNGPYKGPSRSGSTDTIRKQFFGAIFRALIRRVQSLPSSRWPALGAALHGAIERRDIMLYDRRPDVETAIQSVGASGNILQPPGDSLFIVDDNRSYNKLGPYVHEQASYRVTIQPDLWLDSSLTIHYHVDHAPASVEAEGPYMQKRGHAHDFQDFLRVYVPRGARLVGMAGADRWAPQQAYGLTQFAGRFIVRQGHSATVTFHYRVPANVFAASGFNEYSLVVQRQAGTRLAGMHVAVRGGGGVRLRAGNGHLTSTVNTPLSLTTDSFLTVPIEGSLSPRSVRLPPLPTVPDPYIPWNELYDPHHPL